MPDDRYDDLISSGRSSRRRSAQATPEAAPAEAQGPLLTPGGKPYPQWLAEELGRQRGHKAYSAPAISDRHAELLDEDRRLLRRHGYPRRQASIGNILELAIELHHEYIRRLGEPGPGH